MNTATAHLADSQHPWIGLASFTEGDREFFAGRGEEIDELLRLVRRDTLTLLYGVSGLGKTSLLQAGLFPALRAEDYLPVPIRLDYLEGAPPLASQVLGAITAAADAARVEAPQPRPDETLWEYFHREGNHFWSPRNDLVTPFVAFDQFEELFTLGRETPECATRAIAFISELADLVENRPPAALRDDPLCAKEFSFKPAPLKVLLAMREDYLADIDRIRSHFRALGQNRQRLLPMGERQARQVIALGAPLLAPCVDDRILKFVAGGDDAAAEITIAPALLSLVLRELNERRLARGPDAKITPDLLDVEQQKIFEDFYLRTIQNFPVGVRTFIEDKLLTTTGYRDSCALDDALSCQDVTQAILNELVNRRLLAYEDRHNTRRVELTHDVLIPVIKASRDTRIAREMQAQVERQRREVDEKMRTARRRFAILAVLLLLAVAAAIYGWYEAKHAKDQEVIATNQTAIAEDLVQKAIQVDLGAADELIAEQDWATRLVHLYRALGYSHAARYSALNARAAAAIWSELRYGPASRAPLLRCFVTSPKDIGYMAWSPTEPLLATGGNEGQVLLWSLAGKDSVEVSGKPVAQIDHSDGRVSGLRFSADGAALVVTRNKGWEVFSTSEKRVIFTSPPGESLLDGNPFSPDGMQAVSRLNGGLPRIVQTTIPDDHGLELAGAPLTGGIVAWSPKGDRVALADAERMINVYAISKTAGIGPQPKAIEAFKAVAPIRAASEPPTPTAVNGLSFDVSGDLLLVKDTNGNKPLFEVWKASPTGWVSKARAQAEFRAWIPNRSLLLERPVGDGPAVILDADLKNGRPLPIKDPSKPQFSADGSEVLFIQSKRNYQVLNPETGYPISCPFRWWQGPVTARLSLFRGLIASAENRYELTLWDLRPEQRRWYADPPQPLPVAPAWNGNKWKADIGVEQCVQVSSGVNEWNPAVVISWDDQPSTVGWSGDGRYLRIYSENRGYIDLEWDPPMEIEEPIRKLVELLVDRKYDENGALVSIERKDRIKLRREMPTWQVKDPRWRKLLDWWIAGRPPEPPSAGATTNKKASPTVSPLPSVLWVFPDSSYRPLTEVEIQKLSDEQLWRARKEIYTRRGLIFQTKRGIEFAPSLGTAYHGFDPDQDRVFNRMNGVEQANVVLIKSEESQRQ
jgi:WD40 repeat protein